MGAGWVKALADYLDSDELIQLAQDLVRLDTTNPPGNELAAARRVQQAMQAIGFEEVHIYEPAPGRGSVTGRFGPPPGQAGRTLLWNGHLDVVPAGDPAAWRYPPFSATVAEGRLWGRGSADMKGAVAAILEAAAILRRAGVPLQGCLVVQAVADEEMLGDLGTRYLVRQGVARADAAICGEPTQLQPMVAARGLVWLELSTLGKSCHASTPHLGINAIVKMGRVIEALEKLPLPGHHPLLGGPTLCISTIRGGEKTNVVPDRCTITIDRRLIPGETPEQAVEQVRAELARLAQADPELAFELRVLQTARPSSTDPAHPIVQAVLQARRELGLPELAPGGMPGTTDARWLEEAGIPTVIVGPGELKQAHSIDESVSVEELKQAALLYAAVVCQFVGTDGLP